MNRRDFFSTIVFGLLSMFITRKTQAEQAMKHLEGKTVPRGLYISQCVGRGKPMYPQREIPILHLKSVVEGQESRATKLVDNRDNGPAFKSVVQ